MTGADRVERAAELLCRLLDDPQLRRRFRAAPEPLLQEAGLGELGPSLSGGVVALHTLELRESRSSLAGVMAAAVAEGIGLMELYELTRDRPRTEAARVVQRAATRAGLGTLRRGDPPRTAVTARLPSGGKEPAKPSGPDVPAARGRSGAHAAPSGRGPARSGAVARPRPDARDSAPAEIAADAGGDSVAELLDNPRLELPGAARADLASASLDPRVPALLERLLRDHRIRLSVIRTGHSQFVRGGGGVSNHFTGRALDIAAVDGTAVSAGNLAAHELAAGLAHLPASLRPSEVGSPWSFSPSTIYFHDSDHNDHIHVGWDDAAPRGRFASRAETGDDDVAAPGRPPGPGPVRSGPVPRPTSKRVARSGAHRAQATRLLRDRESDEASAIGSIVRGAPTKYAADIDKAAARYRLDPNLLRGLIRQESNFNADARSSAGAIGLCQLMPGTARSLGVDPTDPQQNIMGGAHYLRQQLDAFRGDERLALAAYNAGPGAVSSAGGIPQNGQTPEYVRKVLQYAREYGRMAPGQGDDLAARADAKAAEPPVARSGPVHVARSSVPRSGPQPVPADAADAAASGGLGERMVAIARRELGERETSNNYSPRIAQYDKSVPGSGAGDPWCAIFVSWVARKAGQPLGNRGEGFAGVSALWTWAQGHGDTELAGSGYRPRAGDLVLYNPYGSHIGMVERVLPNGDVQTIEGNYSDRVDEVRRRPSEIYGYVRMR